MSTVKHVVPIRYSAWLAGDLGRQLEATAKANGPKSLKVTRLPRALLLENIGHASAERIARALDTHMAKTYPVFYKEMGPVWTGTIQAVYSDAPRGGY